MAKLEEVLDNMTGGEITGSEKMTMLVEGDIMKEVQVLYVEKDGSAYQDFLETYTGATEFEKKMAERLLEDHVTYPHHGKFPIKPCRGFDPDADGLPEKFVPEGPHPLPGPKGMIWRPPMKLKQHYVVIMDGDESCVYNKKFIDAEGDMIELLGAQDVLMRAADGNCRPEDEPIFYKLR